MNAIVTALLNQLCELNSIFKLDESAPFFGLAATHFGRVCLMHSASLSPMENAILFKACVCFGTKLQTQLAARVTDFIKQEAQHGIARQNESGHARTRHASRSVYSAFK